MSLRSQMRYMNPYDIHKALVNEYILQKPGDTRFLKRDTSKDRRDVDVIKENHRFLWNNSSPETWEEQFAKKYYDKLFKEYCIGDLSQFKENKIALRWRIEQEVVMGKGQFTCGNKVCDCGEALRTWEVNFGYMEHGEKKNALVKIRLCLDCSKKLNYHSRKREVKRAKRKQLIGHDKKRDKTIRDRDKGVSSSSIDVLVDSFTGEPSDTQTKHESPWENVKTIEVKSREEEMEDYLQELLL